MSNRMLDQSTESAVLINPFPGLRPFEFDESHLFFGRDGQSEQLIAKLAATRFLAVVGASGSGKSSLARAGLLPALYSGFMPSAGSGWRMAVMRPGNDPLGNLAQALNEPDVFGSDDEANRALQIAITEATLRRGSRGLVESVQQANLPMTENLLVVADQFEELFRVEQGAQDAERENDRAAFVKLLLEAKQRREAGPNIYVVLTMRSDYLGDCAQFWDLPEAINEGQYLIPRLTREQRREAITGPIFVGGAEATPRLINRLLNDVGDDPDQLPILQHALMRTWDEWQEKRLKLKVDGVERWHREAHAGEALDLCCYEAIGGMADALSLHADEAFKELPDKRHREVAEKVFKALTEKGPDTREIRRPAALAALCAVADAGEAEVKQVIETFRAPGRSFLTPPMGKNLTTESLIDISHESLMRNWQRLNEWVEEEAKSARIYRRLAETAGLYLKGEAGLWRDPDLQLALDWQTVARPSQHWAERYDKGYEAAIAFLEKSAAQRAADREAAERQQREEAERVKRELAAAQALADAQQQRAEEQAKRAEEQTKATTKSRRLAVAMVLLFLLALLAAWIAYSFYRSAEAERASANQQQMRAHISELEALFQKGNAITAQKDAEKAANDAKEERRKAELRGLEANKHRNFAQKQAKLAVELQYVAEDRERFAAGMLERLQTEMAKASPEVQEILARINLQNTIRHTAKANNVSNSSVASANRAQPRKPQQFGLKLWENGATLRIRFMDGTPEQHQKVLQIAQEWSKYANLQFEANASPNAEIRVSFKSTGGYWSYIGTDALSIPATEPTMNFGWMEEGAILHEFGHVLGLIHENQNPNANLPWNKEVVYRELTGPPNFWSKQLVENTTFEKFEGIEYREFDPDSIMMYVYPSAWFTDGRSRGGKKVLSESDKRFARRLYPQS